MPAFLVLSAPQGSQEWVFPSSLGTSLQSPPWPSPSLPISVSVSLSSYCFHLSVSFGRFSVSFSLWVLLVSLYDLPYMSCPCFPRVSPPLASASLSISLSSRLLFPLGPRCSLCISPPHLKEGPPVTLFASVLFSVVSWPGTCLLALWLKGYSRQISATFAQGHSTCCSPRPPSHPLWPCPLSL